MGRIQVTVMARATLVLAALALAGWLGVTPASADAPSDPAELEAFLDGFFASAMEQYHVPGVVFVMVKDDHVFLAKGYGYADLEAERHVDPEKTLFRVGSVSKLFTATAVMQLVEQGKLDLHRDVNAYLQDLQLPAAFPEPVTVHHLLTHTAGFDERFFGMAARQQADLRPLGPYLADRMPRRALPPGDVVSYSNHGFALAGLVVQSVSGMPFEVYMKEHIFAPLGMIRSVFSLPPELAPDLAQGYVYRDHANYPVPYDYLEMLAPAGSLMSTGADIARFMLAHLQNGQLGSARILSEETARRIHTRQFTHHPRLPGFAYDFTEDVVNGRLLIGHGGNWRGFTSRLVLDLEAKIGLFVSYNALSFAGTENGLHIDLVNAFYDRYFPSVSTPLPEPPADFVSRAKRFSGSYRHNRYIRDSFGKLAALLGEWQVSTNPDGTLTVHPPGGSQAPVKIVEVEPLVFLRDDGEGYVVFRENDDGRITHMFLNILGPAAFDKLSALESAGFQLGLLAAIVVLFLSALLGWPLAYLLRRPSPTHSPGARAARWLAAVTGFLFLFTFVAFVQELSGDPFEYTYGVPARTVTLLRVNYLTTALAVGMAGLAVLAWRRRWWTLLARLHYTTIALAAIALIPFFIYWRLLGFSY